MIHVMSLVKFAIPPNKEELMAFLKMGDARKYSFRYFQKYFRASPILKNTNIHSYPDRRMTKDFIYLTLMASWLVNLPWEGSEPFDLLDFYAGRARVSRLANCMGYVSRAFDLDYETAPAGESIHAGRSKRSAFDINGEAGFLLLGFFKDSVICLNLCSQWIPKLHQLYHERMSTSTTPKLVDNNATMFSPLQNNRGNNLVPNKEFDIARCLRLAILMILGGRPGCLLALLGVVCSTWSVVNRATSMRDLLVPLGQLNFLSVRRGNKMVARTLWWNVYGSIINGFILLE